MVEQQRLTPPPPQSLQSAKEIHQFQHDVDELKSWMAEKEAVLGSEDQDLHSIQTLLRQHQELQVRRRRSTPPDRCGRVSPPGGKTDLCPR